MFKHTVNFFGILVPRISRSVNNIDEFCLTQTTKSNICKIGSMLNINSPTIICGPPGCGKTLTIESCAKMLGNIQVIKLHYGNQSQADIKSMIGTYITSYEKGSFDWIEGILLRAVKNGAWLILEELDLVPIEIIKFINQIIENRGIYIDHRNEMVKMNDNFRIFGTIRTSLNGQHHKNKIEFTTWLFCDFQEYNKTDLKLILNHKFIILSQKNLIEKFIELFLEIKRNKKNDEFYSSRINIDSLIKFCNRMERNLVQNNNDFQINQLIFLEAIDTFFQGRKISVQMGSDYDHVYSIGNWLGVSEEFMYSNIYKKDIKLDYHSETESFRFGRSMLKLVNHPEYNVKGTKTNIQEFTYVNYHKNIIEKIASAVEFKEPVLLVGETGTGKTTMVQQLAHLLNVKLNVINMSQQSEIADLVGGFKPIDNKNAIGKVYNEFIDIFTKSFKAQENLKFLTLAKKFYEEDQLELLYKCFQKGIERYAQTSKNYSRKIEQQGDYPNKKTNSEKDTILCKRWAKFQIKINSMRSKNKLMFDYIDGVLTTSIKMGEWVLLDEINLANIEVLSAISGVLDKEGSILLTERGETNPVKRNQNFRIFACMNPATDVGKKDLPGAFKYKFTEIIVEQIENFKDDLVSIVKNMICKSIDSSILNIIVNNIIDFYYKCKDLQYKRLIFDTAGQTPNYTLRTLCRSTKFFKNSLDLMRIEEALSESFEAFFVNMLEESSELKIRELIKMVLLKDVSHSFSFMKRDKKLYQRIIKYEDIVNTAPLNLKDFDFVEISSYLVPIGKNNIITKNNFIMTETTKNNLKKLARALSANEYPILLQGPTSSGKTSIIKFLASITGNYFVRINNHEHTDIQEYTGSYISNGTGFKFEYGPLIKAIKNGYWLVLDELNLAPTEILEALNRLLDDNRELFIPETNEVIKPHKNFVLFATQNPAGTIYSGRKRLSLAFKNRFIEINFREYPDSEVKDVIRHKYMLPNSFCAKMIETYKKMHKRRCQFSFVEGRDGFVTLRDLFKWADRHPTTLEELALHAYFLFAEKARCIKDKNIIIEIINQTMKINLGNMDDYYSLDKIQNLYVDWDISSFTNISWTKSFKRLFYLLSECIRNKEPVLLVGETGCGKTKVCQFLSQVRKQNIHILNCHQNTETSDFIGSQKPSVNLDIEYSKIANKIHTTLTKIIEIYKSNNEEDISEITTLDFSDKEVVIRQFAELINEKGAFLNKIIKNEILDKDNKFLKHDLEQIVKMIDHLQSVGFSWQDGPLIKSMLEGSIFLMDEISLAEDSVLERINSVLEKERNLNVAENTQYSMNDTYSSISINEQFSLIGTMNPGTYFGKKELSPALRNRFSEIWAPQIEDENDIKTIIIDNINKDEKIVIADCILLFCNWLKEELRVLNATEPLETSKFIFSVRDFVTWAQFIDFCMSKGMNMNSSLLNGLCMVYLDALGTDSSIYSDGGFESKSIIHEFRIKCIQNMKNILANQNCLQAMKEEYYIDPNTIADYVESQEITDSSSEFGISPFNISKGTEKISYFGFSLNAPTPVSNIKRIIRAMQSNKPILLEGETGTGKTKTIQIISQLCGYKLIRINLSEQTDLLDLYGCYVPSSKTYSEESSDKCSMFEWKSSPFIEAIENGHWILLDEVNLANQQVLEGINSCLDHRKEIYIPEIDKTIKARKNTEYKIFATMNSSSSEIGRKKLPRSFLNRFTKVFVEPLNEFDLKIICQDLFKEKKDIYIKLIDKIVAFNISVHKYALKEKKNTLIGSPFEFNIRDIKRFVTLIQKEIEIIEKCSPITSKLLYQIADRCLDLVYLQRMRTFEDRLNIVNIYNKTLYSNDCKTIDYYVNKTIKVQVNDSEISFGNQKLHINKYNHVTPTYSKIFPQLYRKNLQLLYNLVICINMNWMSIIEGPPASEKINSVKFLASVSNNNVVIIDGSKETDVKDLIGGYEQYDIAFAINEYFDKISAQIHIYFSLHYNYSVQTSTKKHILDIYGKLREARDRICSSKPDQLKDLLFLVKDLKYLIEINFNHSSHTKSNHMLRSNIDQLINFIETQRFNNQGFQWIDGPLLRAIQHGHWLVFQNANLCNTSVMDRMVPLVEESSHETANRLFYVHEKGVDSSGDCFAYKIHKNFRMFIVVDMIYKNINSSDYNISYQKLSRPMRNRGIELCLTDDSMSESFDIKGSNLNIEFVNYLTEAFGIPQYESLFIIESFNKHCIKYELPYTLHRLKRFYRDGNIDLYSNQNCLSKILPIFSEKLLCNRNTMLLNISPYIYNLAYVFSLFNSTIIKLCQPNDSIYKYIKIDEEIRKLTIIIQMLFSLTSIEDSRKLYKIFDLYEKQAYKKDMWFVKWIITNAQWFFNNLHQTTTTECAASLKPCTSSILLLDLNMCCLENVYKKIKYHELNEMQYSFKSKFFDMKKCMYFIFELKGILELKVFQNNNKKVQNHAEKEETCVDIIEILKLICIKLHETFFVIFQSEQEVSNYQIYRKNLYHYTNILLKMRYLSLLILDQDTKQVKTYSYILFIYKYISKYAYFKEYIKSSEVQFFKDHNELVDTLFRHIEEKYTLSCTVHSAYTSSEIYLNMCSIYKLWRRFCYGFSFYKNNSLHLQKMLKNLQKLNLKKYKAEEMLYDSYKTLSLENNYIHDITYQLMECFAELVCSSEPKIQCLDFDISKNLNCISIMQNTLKGHDKNLYESNSHILSKYNIVKEISLINTCFCFSDTQNTKNKIMNHIHSNLYHKNKNYIELTNWITFIKGGRCNIDTRNLYLQISIFFNYATNVLNDTFKVNNYTRNINKIDNEHIPRDLTTNSFSIINGLKIKDFLPSKVSKVLSELYVYHDRIYCCSDLYKANHEIQIELNQLLINLIFNLIITLSKNNEISVTLIKNTQAELNDLSCFRSYSLLSYRTKFNNLLVKMRNLLEGHNIYLITDLTFVMDNLKELENIENDNYFNKCSFVFMCFGALYLKMSTPLIKYDPYIEWTIKNDIKKQQLKDTRLLKNITNIIDINEYGTNSTSENVDAGKHANLYYRSSLNLDIKLKDVFVDVHYLTNSLTKLMWTKDYTEIDCCYEKIASLDESLQKTRKELEDFKEYIDLTQNIVLSIDMLRFGISMINRTIKYEQKLPATELIQMLMYPFKVDNMPDHMFDWKKIIIELKGLKSIKQKIPGYSELYRKVLDYILKSLLLDISNMGTDEFKFDTFECFFELIFVELKLSNFEYKNREKINDENNKENDTLEKELNTLMSNDFSLLNSNSAYLGPLGANLIESFGNLVNIFMSDSKEQNTHESYNQSNSVQLYDLMYNLEQHKLIETCNINTNLFTNYVNILQTTDIFIDDNSLYAAQPGTLKNQTNTFNFYRTSHKKEIYKLTDTLYKLYQTLSISKNMKIEIYNFREIEFLLEKILSTSAKISLDKIACQLVGLIECLKDVLKYLENLNIKKIFNDLIQRLTIHVTEWKKMEVKSWESILNTVVVEFYQKDNTFWIELYSLIKFTIQDIQNLDSKYLGNLFDTVGQYMLSTSIGLFNKRLEVIKSIFNYLKLNVSYKCKSKGKNILLLTSIENFIYHFSKIDGLLQQKFLSVKESHYNKISVIIKTVNTSTNNIDSLIYNINKSKYQLGKEIKSFVDYLGKGVEEVYLSLKNCVNNTPKLTYQPQYGYKQEYKYSFINICSIDSEADVYDIGLYSTFSASVCDNLAVAYEKTTCAIEKATKTLFEYSSPHKSTKVDKKPNKDLVKLEVFEKKAALSSFWSILSKANFVQKHSGLNFISEFNINNFAFIGYEYILQPPYFKMIANSEAVNFIDYEPFNNLYHNIVNKIIDVKGVLSTKKTEHVFDNLSKTDINNAISSFSSVSECSRLQRIEIAETRFNISKIDSFLMFIKSLEKRAYNDNIYTITEFENFKRRLLSTNYKCKDALNILNTNSRIANKTKNFTKIYNFDLKNNAEVIESIKAIVSYIETTLETIKSNESVAGYIETNNPVNKDPRVKSITLDVNIVLVENNLRLLISKAKKENPIYCMFLNQLLDKSLFIDKTHIVQISSEEAKIEEAVNCKFNELVEEIQTEIKMSLHRIFEASKVNDNTKTQFFTFENAQESTKGITDMFSLPKILEKIDYLKNDIETSIQTSVQESIYSVLQVLYPIIEKFSYMINLVFNKIVLKNYYESIRLSENFINMLHKLIIEGIRLPCIENESNEESQKDEIISGIGVTDVDESEADAKQKNSSEKVDSQSQINNEEKESKNCFDNDDNCLDVDDQNFESCDSFTNSNQSEGTQNNSNSVIDDEIGSCEDNQNIQHNNDKNSIDNSINDEAEIENNIPENTNIDPQYRNNNKESCESQISNESIKQENKSVLEENVESDFSLSGTISVDNLEESENELPAKELKDEEIDANTQISDISLQENIEGNESSKSSKNNKEYQKMSKEGSVSGIDTCEDVHLSGDEHQIQIQDEGADFEKRELTKGINKNDETVNNKSKRANDCLDYQSQIEETKRKSIKEDIESYEIIQSNTLQDNRNNQSSQNEVQQEFEYDDSESKNNESKTAVSHRLTHDEPFVSEVNTQVKNTKDDLYVKPDCLNLDLSNTYQDPTQLLDFFPNTGILNKTRDTNKNDRLQTQNLEISKNENYGKEEIFTEQSGFTNKQETFYIWKRYETSTHISSLSLGQRLKSILDPNVKSQLKGDYKTGKRLNMKKIIPYIASNFKKDKIWMKREKKGSREYNVVVAIDNSSSMKQNLHTIHTTFSCLSLVYQAFNICGISPPTIIGFGESAKTIVDKNTPKSTYGSDVISSLLFNEKSTDISNLIKKIFLSIYPNIEFDPKSPVICTTENWNLVILLSDGIFHNHEYIRSLISYAFEARIIIVFIAIRNSSENRDIIDLENVTFETNGGLKISKYMETFPFQYYVILENVGELPGVLSDLLNQFFQSIKN